MNRGVNKRLAASVWAFSILAAMAAQVGCNSTTSKAPAGRSGTPGPIPVGVAPVQRRDLPVYLVGLGSVMASNSVAVKSRVDGQLVQIGFKEGQQVHKGQLLAVIDARPFEVQLAQAQAVLFRDQAQLRDAKLNLERFRSLFKDSGAFSQQQVDTQAALVDQYDGAVRNDQAQIDSAKLQITYCHITAPIDGRIGLRLVDVGNIVHASDPNPMLIITQLQPIAVLFALPEDQLPIVAQRMKSGSLKVEAYSRDDQTKLASGQLLTIDNEIDQTTGTGKLKALFDNQDSALWPNQFVNIHLLLETRKDALLVPSAAIQRGPQGSFAYVVKADKTVEVRIVTVALTQDNLSVVSQGLSSDELVVIDGQDKLQSGSRVEARAGNPASSGGSGGNGGGAGLGRSGPTGSGSGTAPTLAPTPTVVPAAGPGAKPATSDHSRGNRAR